MNTEKKIGLLSKLPKKAIGALVLALILVAVGIGLGERFFTDTKTTKLGFENIGELATQASYVTEVSVIDKSVVVWKVELPWTKSKYIFSCDFIIKAGFDFTEIEHEVTGNTIKVTLPKVKVLSREMVRDSTKVFHEDSNIFTPNTLENNLDALKEMEQNAENTAIENGLYDNATANAEAMLKSFIGSVYDLNEYQIEFSYKQ